MKFDSTRSIRLLALAGALAATSAFGQKIVPAFSQNAIYAQRERSINSVLIGLLKSQRQDIFNRKLHFSVGFTYALEHDLKSITGGVKITDPSVVTRQRVLSDQFLALDKEAVLKAIKTNPEILKKMPIYVASPKPTDKALDWRKFGAVTPVKRQLGGTCWAYASVAALESSSLLLNKQNIDASEHYVITNDSADWYVPGNFNGGGWCYKAIQFLVNTGTVAESTDPDNGTAGTPNPSIFKPYGGAFWGFCHGTNGQATVQEIKQALCDHGPVGTWIDAGGTFGSYTGGIYDDTSTNHSVAGHFVLIIGWDDSKGAWLIKNSWGTTWGDTCGYGTELGYAWVAYGVHGIGTDACWVHDHPTYYQIDPAKIRAALNRGRTPVRQVRPIHAP